jgi:hypothetical protein
MDKSVKFFNGDDYVELIITDDEDEPKLIVGSDGEDWHSIFLPISDMIDALQQFIEQLKRNYVS